MESQNYNEWLIEQHYKAAQSYRVALYKAWQSVVDFPEPVIISELRMVALPKYETPTFEVTQAIINKVYNETKKPDWVQIRADFIKQYITKGTP